MRQYLSWSEQIITDFSDKNINDFYNRGYLFTREGRGQIYETRSVRVDLSKFKLSSENRRVLRKSEDLRFKIEDLPFADYSWEIGKMGKDFYEKKFGKGVFSANKIKELMTDGGKSNFNRVLVYLGKEESGKRKEGDVIGYCICLETNELLHYCYPFYSFPFPLSPFPNTGMSMMTRAVVWAQEQGKKYIYLGSAKDAVALYKLQFAGVEWWDGKAWKTDAQELKNILK